MDTPNFVTTSEKVAEKYTGTPHKVSTVPVRSRVRIHFDVAAGPNADTVIAIARKQELGWFTFAQGDPISDGHGGTRSATELDTTLTQARRIVGDGAIEEIAVSCTGTFARFATADIPAGITDTEVKEVLFGGHGRLYDPAALCVPRQLGSPFNAMDGVFQTVIDRILVAFDYGTGDKRIKLGTLLEFGGADARADLLRNGGCRCSFKVPEGLLVTDETGSPLRDFAVIGTLAQPVGVVIEKTKLGGASFITPASIAVEIEMRLGGLYFSQGSLTC